MADHAPFGEKAPLPPLPDAELLSIEAEPPAFVVCTTTDGPRVQANESVQLVYRTRRSWPEVASTLIERFGLGFEEVEGEELWLWPFTTWADGDRTMTLDRISAVPVASPNTGSRTPDVEVTVGVTVNTRVEPSGPNPGGSSPSVLSSDGRPTEQLAPCPCCGHVVLDAPDNWEICPICGWEDAPAQARAPGLHTAPNGRSLLEAQVAFHIDHSVALGASRRSTAADRRPPGWRPLDLVLDGDTLAQHPATAFHRATPFLVRMYLARQPSVHPDVEPLLVADPDWRVRRAAAAAEWVDHEAIAVLATDPIADVRTAAARKVGPETFEQSRALLVSDPDPRVRAAFAASPAATTQDLDRLARDTDERVRTAVAQHRATSPEVLRFLADDPARRVRVRVAAHPQVPDSVRRRLLQDPEQQVRWAAEERKIFGR